MRIRDSRPISTVDALKDKKHQTHVFRFNLKPTHISHASLYFFLKSDTDPECLIRVRQVSRMCQYPTCAQHGHGIQIEVFVLHWPYQFFQFLGIFNKKHNRWQQKQRLGQDTISLKSYPGHGILSIILLILKMLCMPHSFMDIKSNSLLIRGASQAFCTLTYPSKPENLCPNPRICIVWTLDRLDIVSIWVAIWILILGKSVR